MSVDRLHQDDLAALADLVAERVLDGLAGAGQLVERPAHEDGTLLTAAQVAERLGVTRGWVYANAGVLGARRLGDRPKGRLRFDADTVAAALRSRCAGEESPDPAFPAGRRIRQELRQASVLNQLGSLPERWQAAVAEGTGRDVGPRAST